MRFPDRTTPIGQTIHGYLNDQLQQEDHVIHLLFSANRWERAHAIEEAMLRGATVVIDRYYYSGCVYSAAKRNPSMDLAWCRRPEVGLPRPDLCLFLDVSPEQAARRGGYGHERYEQAGLQTRVRELFEELQSHDDERADIVRIDADGNVEEVEHLIQNVVQEKLAQFGNLPDRPLRTISSW